MKEDETMGLKNKTLLMVGYQLQRKYTDERKTFHVDLKIGYTRSVK